MTEADLNRVPVPNPVVVLREEFDDWALLFNPDSARVVGLNPTGVAVWKLLDGTRTLGDIAAAIREQFDSVPASASEELSAFVADLESRGFLGEESPHS